MITIIVKYKLSKDQVFIIIIELDMKLMHYILHLLTVNLCCLTVMVSDGKKVALHKTNWSHRYLRIPHKYYAG